MLCYWLDNINTIFFGRIPSLLNSTFLLIFFKIFFDNTLVFKIKEIWEDIYFGGDKCFTINCKLTGHNLTDLRVILIKIKYRAGGFRHAATTPCRLWIKCDFFYLSCCFFFSQTIETVVRTLGTKTGELNGTYLLLPTHCKSEKEIHMKRIGKNFKRVSSNLPFCKFFYYLVYFIAYRYYHAMLSQNYRTEKSI